MNRAKHERNWVIWRQYRTTSATLAKIGRAHGIGPQRVHNIVREIDRALRTALTRERCSPVPTSDAEREGTLGIEFVFTHELSAPVDEYGDRQLFMIYEGSCWEPLLSRRRAFGGGWWGEEPSYAPKRLTR